MKLVIYNTLGEIVIELVDEIQNAGEYTYLFGGGDYGFPPGVYFAKIRVGAYTHTLRIVEL